MERDNNLPTASRRHFRTIALWTVIVGASGGPPLISAQAPSNRELVKLIEDDSTRDAAVQKIVASGNSKARELLEWTQGAPKDVNTYRLYLGLAEVFGQLRMREAIPFLIRNITLEIWPQSPNIWMKSPSAIRGRMPAVSALIEIGKAASLALINEPLEGMPPDRRLATMFVVGQVAGVPESKEFLNRIISQANTERFWAEEGLKHLETQQ